MIDQTRYAEARTPLKEASIALGNYSGSHVSDAQELRVHIDSLLANYDQKREQAGTDVQQWWNQIAGWTAPQSYSTSQNANSR